MIITVTVEIKKGKMRNFEELDVGFAMMCDTVQGLQGAVRFDAYD